MGNELRAQGKSKKKISAFTWIFIFGALALAVIVPRFPMSTDQKEAIGLYLALAIFGTPILIFVSSFLLFKKVISSYPKLYLWIAEGAFILAVSQMVPELEQIQAARTAAATAATQNAPPTSTSTSTLTPRPTPTPTTPTPTITHTPTATLLPMFLTATEIASIATQAMIVETEYALALTATVEALVATVTYRLSFEDIDFRELRDYPDNHIGEKVCVEGFISEVYSPTDFQMLVGDLADAVYVVTATEFSKIYRGDQVRICGVSDGYSLLKNLLRGQESTPLVKDAFFP